MKNMNIFKTNTFSGDGLVKGLLAKSEIRKKEGRCKRNRRVNNLIMFCTIDRPLLAVFTSN